MASFLRQIVAGPRAPHPESDLDLCYVTDNIIATSGPSQAYPQRAYRNPLTQLVSFLDARHGEDWAIWEFRAEGTGYPDEAVYGRVRHYPFPDHHPPPFRLMPLMMASMRNWLRGGELHNEGGEDTKKDEGAEGEKPAGTAAEDMAEVANTDETKQTGKATETDAETAKTTDSGKTADPKGKRRVAVVHCKAGKGRSGTVSCSYLISEEGWTAEDALRRFTQRRMRPGFGAGVTIPSQLRWVGYVDRWTRSGKHYVDRPVEILEVRVRGLRNGVSLDVEGYADEGKRIATAHAFSREERVLIEGDAPDGGGLADIVWDLAGYPASAAGASPTASAAKAPAQADLSEAANDESPASGSGSGTNTPASADQTTGTKMDMFRKHSAKLIKMAATASKFRGVDGVGSGSSSGGNNKTAAEQQQTLSKSSSASSVSNAAAEDEPGGQSVVFRPRTPIRVANSDVNIAVERRNRARKGMGLAVTTAVGHVWFNAFFEGSGPERVAEGGQPDSQGVFSIAWEAMDGIKGTSRKGSRALDSIEVVWRLAPEEGKGEVVEEPGQGDPVPEPEPADWKGGQGQADKEKKEGETASIDGVKSSGPAGGELS